MNQQVVLERFLCFSGLSPEEAQPRQGICKGAIQELNVQVPTGAEGGAALLNAVAAVLAFYRCSVAQSSTLESDFTAGDVRAAKSSAGMEAARRPWLEARRATASYLRDEEFYFGQVRS